MYRLKPALLALLVHEPARGAAFVAPPSRLAVEEHAAVAAVPVARATQQFSAGAFDAQPLGSSGSTALFAGAAVAGALAALLGRKKRSSRDGAISLIGMGPFTVDPGPPELYEGRYNSYGPEYQSYKWRKKRSRYANGMRMRFFRQNKILKELGVWEGYREFEVWDNNRDLHSMYKGPESHPDNPWFPAPSGGFPMEALAARAPAPLVASTPQKSAGAFAGSTVPTFGLAKKRLPRGVFGNARAERRGLVLRAHKKAAASTKNQGHRDKPWRWGVQRNGRFGCSVKMSETLVKQKGVLWKPGANVKVCKDNSLVAKCRGIVQMRGNGKYKEVFVVPYDYFKEKCRMITTELVGHKEYEPWMGRPDKSHNTKGQKLMKRPIVRDYYAAIRQVFLDSEKGKEWAAKKAEKKAKQKEIQAKRREKTREAVKRRKEGLPPKGKAEPVSDAVSSAGESDSEAES